MSDNLTKEQRSKTMSRIRSKWTKQEKSLHNRLKGLKIKHKMYPDIEGHPDIILKKKKVAVFLHGCFWHKCPKCYKEPKTDKKYWLLKIQNNVKRDKRNLKLLRKQGYKVVKLWEHDIKKDSNKVYEKIKNASRK